MQSTRVGGATFVKNAIRTDTDEQPNTLQLNTHQTQASSTHHQQRKRTQLARYVSKEEKLRRKYNGAAKAKTGIER